MADLRPTPAPNLATAALSGDVKRNFNEAMGADLGNALGFMDLMVTHISLSHDDTAVKGTFKSAVRTSVGVPEKYEISDTKTVSTTDTTRTDFKDTIKARIREVMAKDQTPIKDPAPLKALKKVAEFLLKANESGAIALPPALVTKLNAFIQKDPAELPAGEAALLLRDIMDGFKQAFVNATPKKADDNAVVWTADILSALKDIGVHVHAQEGQPVTTVQALRVLKALVNKSEHSVLASLADKKQELISAIDPEHVLLGAITHPHECHHEEEAVTEDDSATAVTTTDGDSELPHATLLPVETIIPVAVTETATETVPETAPVASTTEAVPAAPAAEVETPVASTPAPVASADKQVSDEKALLKAASMSLPLSNLLADTEKTAAVAKASVPVLADKTTPVATSFAAAAPAVSKVFSDSSRETTDDAKDVPVFSKSDKSLPAPKFEKPVAGLERAIVAPSDTSSASATPRTDMLQALASGAKTLEPAAPAANTTASATPSALQVDSAAPRFGLSTAASVATQAIKLPPSPAAQQVMVHIQQKLNTGSTQMSLQMTPVELGRVDVRVTVKADGVTSTVITAERPETLNLLQKDAAHLERA